MRRRNYVKKYNSFNYRIFNIIFPPAKFREERIFEGINIFILNLLRNLTLKPMRDFGKCTTYGATETV